MYAFMIPFLQREHTYVLIDSKGHGESSGDIPTYVYYEKYDLYGDFSTSVGLFGVSMGSAISLQSLSLFSKDDNPDF